MKNPFHKIVIAAKIQKFIFILSKSDNEITIKADIEAELKDLMQTFAYAC